MTLGRVFKAMYAIFGSDWKAGNRFLSNFLLSSGVRYEAAGAVSSAIFSVRSMLRPGVPAQGTVGFVPAGSRGAGLVTYATRDAPCLASSWRPILMGSEHLLHGSCCGQGPRLGVLLVSVTELGTQPHLRLFPDPSAPEDVDGAPTTRDIEQREEPDGSRQCRFHDEVFAQRL